jgi:hypothetical protein
MQLSAISRSCEQIECQNMLRPWNALTNLHQGSYSARTWQRVYSQSSLTPLERKDHLFLDAMQISCFCLLQGDSSCTLQRVDSHGLSFSRFKQLQRNGRPWELTTVTHHTSYCMTLLYLHLLTCCNFPGRPFVVHSFDIVPRTKREISDCWWLGDVSLLMMLPNVADALIFWRIQSWHPAEMSCLKHLETWRFSSNLALTKHPHSSDWPKPLWCNRLHGAAPKPFCIAV